MIHALNQQGKLNCFTTHLRGVFQSLASHTQPVEKSTVQHGIVASKKAFLSR